MTYQEPSEPLRNGGLNGLQHSLGTWRSELPQEVTQDVARGTMAGASDYRGDYRGLDYRATDYRDGEAFEGAQEAQVNWFAALWRYQYAIILPVLLGLALSAAYFRTLPNVYRSTARVIVESERPWAPGHESLESVRTIPPAEMLLMQLRSEQIIDQAAKHPALADAVLKMGIGPLRSTLASGVAFQNAMNSSQNDRVVPFNLNFDHQDPNLTVAAVTALSDALQVFFRERSETSIAELKKLITTAKDKLLPELNTLEAEYRDFRDKSELSWDKSGAMINPYREKQLSLQGRRLELEDEQREILTKLAAIESTTQSTKDPMVVMEVIQQLIGEELSSVKDVMRPDTEDEAPSNSFDRNEDLMLAKLAIEKTLIPLEVQRQQFASEFGMGHPSVRQLDQQIIATRDKLNELTDQENERLAELRREGEVPAKDLAKQRADRANLAVSGFTRAFETRRALNASQIAQLDAQIEELAEQATALARAESENAMYLRRIARAQRLFDTVEEQMSKITLSDQGPAIRVSQLNPPSSPALIAPILSRYLTMGALWGGMLGLGLVYLLESQAKMFRSSEEISRLLGLRVLAHVPTDTHKLPKVPKGEVYRFKDVDAGISTVHRPRSITSESIRRLRTSVFFEAKTTGATVIQVTSPLPEDGKSTLAANLAVSIAQSGKSVVVVDSDMRRPQMTSSFKMEKLPGLTELIDGTCDPSQVIHETPVDNLSVVPCGPVPANPAEALSTPQYAEFLDWLRARYDFVIVDTPPLLVVTDPSIVASCVDAVIFTFRIRRGCRPQTKEAVTMLRATGVPILGCVVNRVDDQTASAGYQGYDAAANYGRRYNRYNTAGTVEINCSGTSKERQSAKRPDDATALPSATDAPVSSA